MSETTMSHARRDRVIVGSCGDDASARRMARALLMMGREVVFVGGGQTPEQLARTAQAEDAGTIIVSADASERADVESALAALGASHVQVQECDQPDAPTQANCG